MKAASVGYVHAQVALERILVQLLLETLVYLRYVTRKQSQLIHAELADLDFIVYCGFDESTDSGLGDCFEQYGGRKFGPNGRQSAVALIKIHHGVDKCLGG